MVVPAEVQRLNLVILVWVTPLPLLPLLWQIQGMTSLGLRNVPTPPPRVGGCEVLVWHSTGLCRENLPGCLEV